MIINLAKGLCKQETELRSDRNLFIERRGKTPESNLLYISDTLKGQHFHNNFLEYLELAWGGHRGVVLSPDIFWYTVLCELANIIKDSPDKYRHLFTTTPKKTEILVQSDSLTVLPMDKISSALKTLIPDKFADSFLQRFSTTDDDSSGAMQSAFADAVSPFYDYGMFLCGIPFINLTGEKDDWMKIKESWSKIHQAFKDNGDYFCEVSKIIDGIIEHFSGNGGIDFKKMFYLERCGSGHQVEVRGWIQKLFTKIPEDVQYSCNFPTHVSQVNYKQVDTQKNYQMHQGLFTSIPEDDLLVPSFGRIIFEVSPHEVKKEETEPKEKTDRLELDTSKVEAKTRKLKANWTVEQEQDKVTYIFAPYIPIGLNFPKQEKP